MNHLTSTTHDHGFTLIEMSIVLVIIGIILASVMKGRDLIYSAKATKAEHMFFLKWQTMLNDYYKATGDALGDGKINGGSSTNPDGYVDFIPFDSMVGYNPGTTPLSRRQNIKTALRTAGIDVCNLITSNVYGDNSKHKCANGMDVFSYMVDSENAGHREVTIGLGHLFIIQGERVHPNGEGQPRLGLKNVLVFFDMPLDYAKRLDTTIDGVAAGDEGKCLSLTHYANDGRGNRGFRDSYTSLEGKNWATRYFTDPKDVNKYAVYARPWPTPQQILNQKPSEQPWPTLNRYFVVGIVLDY